MTRRGLDSKEKQALSGKGSRHLPFQLELTRMPQDFCYCEKESQKEFDFVLKVKRLEIQSNKKKKSLSLKEENKHPVLRNIVDYC